MTWDEFEQMLIERGWTPTDAKREREAQEHGTLGDCDGDLDLRALEWSMARAEAAFNDCERKYGALIDWVCEQRAVVIAARTV